MASAEVLSNSTNPARKQDLLEAGKRRLEEYRKKKAADQAKKAASTSQTRTIDSTADGERPLGNGQAPFSISRDGSMSSELGDTATETSGGVVDAERSYGFSHANQLKPTDHLQAEASFANNVGTIFSEPPNTTKQERLRDASVLANERNANYKQHSDDKVGVSSGHIGEGRYMDGFLSDKFSPLYPNISRVDYSRYNNSGHFRSEEAQTIENDGLGEASLTVNSHIPDIVEYASRQRSGTGSILLQNRTDSVYSGNDSQVTASGFERSILGTRDVSSQVVSGEGKKKPSNSADNLPTFFSESIQVSKPSSLGVNHDAGGPSNHAALALEATEAQPRRSRPSFLDSLNIPRASSAFGLPQHEPQKIESIGVPSTNVLASLPSQKPIQETRILEFQVPNMHDNNMERKPVLYSQRQNEDFAALEQHIEDLTQERFSLQRAIEASKTLAESLAAENSSLTESYNQQASVVNQLKSEMERLQDEIKSQLGELESMKIQHANAQLECNAADERAKLLASEVIGLEEKALRLRSNELKLEKELEKSSAELASCKKKLSSLEKDRRDLQLTIDALQEEKKVLQSKLRKASTMGSSVTSIKGYPKKDVSTATDGLGAEVAALVHGDIAGGSMPPASNLEGQGVAAPYFTDPNISEENRPFSFENSATIIPPDQMQLIQNINSLISELTAEKEELMRALAAEISTSSMLKDINKELSHKLEVQTQRLELLTAQSMAHENLPTKPHADARVIQDNASYADEGDEVVERVLGWIMKLFPGGPSRRRSSKLL
ncbi:hypothetical protein Dimus_028372 [Dionaea muscipula]